MFTAGQGLGDDGDLGRIRDQGELPEFPEDLGQGTATGLPEHLPQTRQRGRRLRDQSPDLGHLTRAHRTCQPRFGGCAGLVPGSEEKVVRHI